MILHRLGRYTVYILFCEEVVYETDGRKELRVQKVHTVCYYFYYYYYYYLLLLYCYYIFLVFFSFTFCSTFVGHHPFHIYLQRKKKIFLLAHNIDKDRCHHYYF